MSPTSGASKQNCFGTCREAFTVQRSSKRPALESQGLPHSVPQTAKRGSEADYRQPELKI